MRQLFGGVLQSRVQCCECNRVSCTEDPIFDVSLDISGCSSVEQAFAKFTRRERLEGANAYECEHCSKQPIKRLVYQYKVYKQCFVWRLQSSIGIHVFL